MSSHHGGGEGLATKMLVSLQHCLGSLISMTAPEPHREVMNLIAALAMTPRHVKQLYRLFRQLKRYDPLSFVAGDDEASTQSMTRVVQLQRRWTTKLLKYLLELAGYSTHITWDGFLYIFLQYAMLSKVELCQVLFYIIAKATKSWTVQVLTSTQLDEFYEDFSECPVKSFDTGSIEFAKLPKAKYRMSDFIELVHHFPQLINPAMHLQGQIQSAMPGLRFWGDYDRVRPMNRKIAIDFFAHKKVISMYQVVNSITEEKNLARQNQEAKAVATKQAIAKGHAIADKNKEVQKAAPTAPGQFPPPPAPMQKMFPNEETKHGFVPLPLGPTPPLKPRKQYDEIDYMPKWMRELVRAHEVPVGKKHAALEEEKNQEQVPLNLPRPWVAVYDPNSEKFYYWNPQDRLVSWKAPEAPKPTSVEAAKELIGKTFQEDEVYAQKEREESLKAKSKAEAERVNAQKRTQELEFIHRSRVSYVEQRSLVQTLERSYPMELIERPARVVHAHIV
mmetsp:Transcript_66637/g.171530  ORF Transcript_66637/g.171530 Transcript_66637/m.171530 type:complete len:504 (+) Transcript_66637:97-1608(+)